VAVTLNGKKNKMRVPPSFDIEVQQQAGREKQLKKSL
jgi:hypothetical protein